jgi:2,3-bisphosphoglycerate-dependent phosphoglycerate mutase
MITKILFIRHGAVTYLEDKDRDLHVPLNKIGFEQADTLLIKFSKLIPQVDFVLASSLLRTQQTVSKIADYYNCKLEILKNLNEHNYNGNAQEFHKNLNNNKQFKFAGGESIQESKDRFASCLNNILRKYIGKVMVIGTHGTILSEFLIENFNLDKDFFFTLSYPDIYEVSFDSALIPIKLIHRTDILPDNSTMKL